MPAMHDLAEKILSQRIDKKQALQHYEKLPEPEKNALISLLISQLSTDRVRNGKRPPEPAKPLKALDQRDLKDGHRTFIRELAARYEAFVPKSKANIEKHQNYFVDQRRAFHLIRELKDLHFQITYKKAQGAYVYDIDGNQYIDISGDMGVNIFGHKPAFIIDAVKASLDQGIPLAGYSETIFKTAKLFCELTGHERALFTQSGTEAVMFAVRIARAATQKNKIVIFEGAFHGLSDAVTAIKDPNGRSLAPAPGMLQAFADQLIVLDYGDMRHLEVIEQRCDEIAAVLVEPVQSRHPYNQPAEFLKELRKLTLEKAIVLIADEMITGFRVCPRGAQGYFNFKADIATYGKIPGGGMPTGVIAGAAKYMDLIDGGAWCFGDDSMPKPKRTSMGGTHSQNPLKIASAFATLSEIEKRCQGHESCDSCTCFQKQLNKKTDYLAGKLNDYFSDRKVPIVIDHFGSLFRFRFVGAYWGITEALFFILLRLNGVETNIQGNCFLTTAHTDEDIEAVIGKVRTSLETLLAEGFFYEDDAKDTAAAEKASVVPNGDSNPARSNSESRGNSIDDGHDNKIQDLRRLIRTELENLREEE